MRPLPFFVFLAIAADGSAEVRKWTSTDGRVIEAEFMRPQGTAVILKMKDGREVPVDLSKLSAGDQEFAKSQGSGTPAAVGKKEPTFSELAIDRKAWIMRPQPETFGITGVVLSLQLETPHFIVTAGPKIKPPMLELYAEVCERLYARMVRDLPGLETKFTDRRMTVWLSADKPGHALLGKCLQDLGASGGDWSEFNISGASFSNELATQKNILRGTRGFQLGYEPSGQRNLLWPERIHFMTSTMVAAYGHAGNQMRDRSFEMFNLSYSYYLENEISGKIETKVRFSDSATNVEGFKNPRGWPAAVKRILGNTPLKPGLQRFMSLDSSEAEPIDVGSGFGLMQFIFRDPSRRAGMNTLLEKARKEQNPPDAKEFAAAMGAASVEAFDQQWLEFLRSDKFN